MKTFLFSLVFLLTACSNPQSENQRKQNQFNEKYPESFRALELKRDKARFSTRATREGVSVKSYDLNGYFDWNARELVAVTTMAFKLSCSCQDSLVLDSQVDKVESIKLMPSGEALSFSLMNSRELAVDLSTIPEAIRKKEMAIAVQYRTHAVLNKNGEPNGIMAVDKKPGDPVTSRIVYTFSEPEDASSWMPCINDPSNRALFSVELKMPVSETLIANGDLVKNEVVGAERVVRYQTRYTLPTYLMAFAQGDLTVATGYHGALPVSVVARRGLSVDYTGVINETIRQIRHFEKLLTPFPFEKYMVVLVPEFSPGGIEHAGISFNDETASSEGSLARDIGLMSHELAHQWFGDSVTVSTWDDLWIKEGMASLLGEEATRPFEDKNGTGRLMANEFSLYAGAAIYDPSLKPDDKYTSGPYGRAAWLLTQIRSQAGEEKFWAVLRQVLTDYKMNAITTEEFIEAFRPAVGNLFIEKVKKAILAKELPTFEIKKTGSVFDITINDKEGALLLPVEMRWLDASGGYETELIQPGITKSHLIGDKRLLFIDDADRHPIHAFGGIKELRTVAQPILAPKNPAQVALLLQAAPHHQKRALEEGEFWRISPADFKAAYPQFGAAIAQTDFVKLACRTAKLETDATVKGAWKSEITSAVNRLPHYGYSTNDEGLSSCSGIVDATLAQAVWNAIEADTENASLSTPPLYFSSMFPMDLNQALSIWGKLAQKGASVRSRVVGLEALGKYVEGATGFAKPDAGNITAWKAFITGLLQYSRTGEVLRVAIPLAVDLQATEAVEALAQIVRSDTWMVWKTALCAGYGMGKKDAVTKARFETALGDVTTLPKSVQEIIKNPGQCGAEEEE